MTSAYASQQAKRPNESAVAITDVMALSQRHNLCVTTLLSASDVSNNAPECSIMIRVSSNTICRFASGFPQVVYSITKHAMRRSADEIGATSISFRPKVFSDATSVVDGIFSVSGPVPGGEHGTEMRR